MTAYVWLGIIILLTIIELMTVNLTTIWFVVSAIVSLCVSLTSENFALQFGIFVVLGIILLITTRPLLQKFLGPNHVKTNIDRIIGMEGIVTEEITKKKLGEVKVDGKSWSAYAEHKIKVGCTVKVLSIDGAKIKVEEMEE